MAELLVARTGPMAGRVVAARPDGWEWGRRERDPARFLLVRSSLSMEEAEGLVWTAQPLDRSAAPPETAEERQRLREARRVPRMQVDGLSAAERRRVQEGQAVTIDPARLRDLLGG